MPENTPSNRPPSSDGIVPYAATEQDVDVLLSELDGKVARLNQEIAASKPVEAHARPVSALYESEMPPVDQQLEELGALVEATRSQLGREAQNSTPPTSFDAAPKAMDSPYEGVSPSDGVQQQTGKNSAAGSGPLTGAIATVHDVVSRSPNRAPPASDESAMATGPNKAPGWLMLPGNVALALIDTIDRRFGWVGSRSRSLLGYAAILLLLVSVTYWAVSFFR